MTQKNNQRTCIVSRSTLPTTQMVRFVVTPDNWVVADIKGNLDGRGMWVSCNGDLLNRAIQKNLFAKAAKQQVKVNTDLLEICTNLLRKKLLGAISLGRRSGNVVNGFEKVKQLLKTGDCQMVFSSAGTSDSAVKLLGMCNMLKLPFYTVLNTDELSQVMAGENVNYAGMKKCGISNVINTEANRLKLLLGGENVNE